ncbi:GPW/gp25 family protein [Oceaniovalibus sp. ACAM 378]|uniref:GPW/gp25 family protein n=1 Tax=Oceaniovalibus sp. ACAM 378 TaxID=2599923 RepID=UPI0011D5BAC5|nr:GPW/gp25 family protein [Oceaniovalibus sp. ACAM 378]TYB89929.1 GPW/gp25 family protein [Oceaniovalibus sp. ACAM 378]
MRQSPDIRPFLGRGTAVPFRPNTRGGLDLVSGPALVEQSIWIILTTPRGSVEMEPRFGCGIHGLVFSDNTAAARAIIAQQVAEALTEWEARIDLIDLRVSEGTEPTEIRIEIDYRLRSNNAFFNLVYPFYVREGRDL